MHRFQWLNKDKQATMSRIGTAIRTKNDKDITVKVRSKHPFQPCRHSK